MHYLDGTTVDVISDQYALSRWAQYANEKGMNTDPADANWLAVVYQRYMAYATLQRNATSRLSFDAWDRTVVEVEIEEPTDVNPTEPTPSADSSPPLQSG